MNIEDIKTIVKLMAENDLSEFKIESEEMTLCLRRGVTPGASAPILAPATILPASVSPVAAAPVPAAVPVEAAPAPKTEAVPGQDAPLDRSKVIESPIVGTFYRSNTPGGQPLVKVGMTVNADTTVGIVEAMKVMNEIKAEKSGVIKEILLENGQSVEYGQPLFILE